MNTMKKYWFFIEPYVYISFVDNAVFLYNTLDGQYVESVDPVIYDMILDIRNKPEGVIVLNQEQLEKSKISSFIQQIRDYFMGDLIDISISGGSPVQFVPILNIQTETNRLESAQERTSGENILLNLNELIFYLNSPSVSPNKYYPSNRSFDWKYKEEGNFDYIESTIRQIPLSIIENLTISIVTDRLEKVENREVLIELLNTTKAKKGFHLYYKDNISDRVFNIENLSITMNIDFPFDDESFDKITRLLDTKNIYKP